MFFVRSESGFQYLRDGQKLEGTVSRQRLSASVVYRAIEFIVSHCTFINRFTRKVAVAGNIEEIPSSTRELPPGELFDEYQRAEGACGQSALGRTSFFLL